MNMFKKNGGFTLVELIVVIAILAILAGIAIPAYSGYITKAQAAGDNTVLSAVKTAVLAAYATEGEVTEITFTNANGVTAVKVNGEDVAVNTADINAYYGEGGTAGADLKTGDTAYWYAVDPDDNGDLKDGWNISTSNVPATTTEPVNP